MDNVHLYKALRPDGTDFATGATKPRKGRWMPRIDGKLVMCERGYHVSDAVAETLVGGSWPCKLARVEIPKGEWRREGHKLVVPTYRVVEWLPAWQALGPNGEAVAAMIDRAAKLTEDEVQRLILAWDTPWGSARSAARDSARGAAWWAAKEAAWEAAYGAAIDAADWAAWMAAYRAAIDAADGGAWEAAYRAARGAAMDAAEAAAWMGAAGAARALVVRDLLTTKQFDILYGPWASVVGSAT